jgi:Tfp pilus assembly protein PilF
MASVDARQRPNRRLETWKEIGSFLNRDARTVRRWELERGLPVLRVPGAKSKVYAYTDDLSAWLTSTGVEAEGDVVLSPEAARGAPTRRGPLLLAGLAAALALVTGGGVLLWARGGGDAAPRAARRTADPEAERLYLAGMSYWNTRTPEGLQKAVDSFTQAVVRDPQYAPAYVGLANCYNLLREYTLMRPEEAYPRAKAAAERAVTLDDSLSEAHSALAFVSFYWSWDAPRARREFDRAIALDPRSSVAHHWRATFLYHLGEFEQALGAIETAQKLAPESASVLADRAAILSQVGSNAEAISVLESLERSQPDFLSSHTYLSQIYEGERDWPRYIVELEHIAGLKADADGKTIAAAARRGLRSGGEQGMLSAILAEQRLLADEGKAPPLALARTYALLGEDRAAIAELGRAVAAHDPNVQGVRIEAPFRRLYADPEFHRVMAPVGLMTPQQLAAADRTRQTSSRGP